MLPPENDEELVATRMLLHESVLLRSCIRAFLCVLCDVSVGKWRSRWRVPVLEIVLARIDGSPFTDGGVGWCISYDLWWFLDKKR